MHHAHITPTGADGLYFKTTLSITPVSPHCKVLMGTQATPILRVPLHVLLLDYSHPQILTDYLIYRKFTNQCTRPTPHPLKGTDGDYFNYHITLGLLGDCSGHY